MKNGCCFGDKVIDEEIHDESVEQAVMDETEVSDSRAKNVSTLEVTMTDDSSEKNVLNTQPDVKENMADNVSILGEKRNNSDVEISTNEVSTPKKRVSYVDSKHAARHDHTYFVSKSPRSLKWQMDDMVDEMTKRKRRLTCSQKKAKRLERKVSTLTDVVSELQENILLIAIVLRF